MSETDRNDAKSAFTELGRMLENEPSPQATLLRVAELVTQTLPAVESASITVVTERGPYTLVSSGRLAMDSTSVSTTRAPDPVWTRLGRSRRSP